jgi:hypothetical protein
MGYFELWDAEARKLGYANYNAYRVTLRPDDKNLVREQLPAQISVAEPDCG